MRDPLYRAIEEGLGGSLDPDLFEQCAAELLRLAYPGLSPVRGGGDAGMDGSIPSTEAPPLPLICTTAENVIGNLTRSLTSYKDAGGTSGATQGLGWSWTGKLSNMWDGWVESFGLLEQHEDARIREVGRIGRERSEAEAAAERERERQEEIYGID